MSLPGPLPQELWHSQEELFSITDSENFVSGRQPPRSAVRSEPSEPAVSESISLKTWNRLPSLAETCIGPSLVGMSAEALKSIVVGGARLAYVEQGSGAPVLFVHGGINDWRTWRAQLSVIGERFRAIAYSRRYAWPNDPIEDDVDDQMLAHVDDLLDLIRALEISPVHLVGNSWGAFICLLAAIREPTLVRTLTIEEPPVLPLFLSTPPRPWELLRLFATRPRTGVAILKFVATGMIPSTAAMKKGDLEEGIRIFGEAVLGKKVFAALPEDFREQIRANSKTQAAQFLGKGFPPLPEEDVRRIEANTLLVTGQESPAFLLRFADRLAELLPHVERVEIPGAGHVMHMQNAPALNRALIDFLAKHS
jgi:non-heme chloroperoxidase